MMLSLLRVYNGVKPTETLAIFKSWWNTIDHRMISELTPGWFQNWHQNDSQLIPEWSQNWSHNDHEIDVMMMLKLFRVYKRGKPTETLAISKSWMEYNWSQN